MRCSARARPRPAQLPARARGLERLLLQRVGRVVDAPVLALGFAGGLEALPDDRALLAARAVAAAALLAVDALPCHSGGHGLVPCGLVLDRPRLGLAGQAVLELAHALADRASNLGQLLRAQHEQGNDEYDN